MEQPQSPDEVQVVVEALRRLDPLLDVQWNPRAVRVTRGSYDALGRRVDPTYDGRWQVIRRETESLHADRTYAVVLTVTQVDRSGPYPVMLHEGAYAPLGMWLVDYMALWDRANRHWQAGMDALWADHERAESWLRTDEEAGTKDALERIYRIHGGEYWMGGAQGKTANAPWLGDSAVQRERQGATP